VPIAEVNGVQLYYEDTGEGFPLIWNHEFAGDCHSLEQQVRHLSRRYRVITYNYRGWPPSSVPGNISAYSTEILVEDLAALLRHLDISRAHIGGLSMGGNVALAFAATHPAAAASVIVVGSGSGTINREAFGKESERLALVFEHHGAAVAGQQIAMRPGRRVYAEKDPRGYAEFVERLQQHSAQGAALMIRGVLLSRKTIFEMEEMLRRISVPALVIVGDRDEGAVGPSVFMQRTLPYASLVVLPFTGHIPNLEEPALFNLHVGEFLASVGEGRWADWRQPHGPA
jgi:pimeloyl-ACP methyl ester carboxylesterase